MQTWGFLKKIGPHLKSYGPMAEKEITASPEMVRIQLGG